MGQGPSVWSPSWAERSQAATLGLLCLLSDSWDHSLIISLGQKFPSSPEAVRLSLEFCKQPVCAQLAATLCPLPSPPPGRSFLLGAGAARLFPAARNGWEPSCLCPAPCYLSNLKAAPKFVLPFSFPRDVELKIKWFRSGSRLNNLGQGMVSDALQETQSVVNPISSCNSTKFS